MFTTLKANFELEISSAQKFPKNDSIQMEERSGTLILGAKADLYSGFYYSSLSHKRVSESIELRNHLLRDDQELTILNAFR